jgi:hypothetical protein
MHPNAYKGPLVSSTSSRSSGSSKPSKPNKKRQFSDDKPSANLSNYRPAPDSKKNRPMASTATYAKQRASPKTYGQAITSETTRITPTLPERISNEDFETTSKVVRAAIPQTIATILVAVVTARWEEISMMTIEWTKTIPEIEIAPHRSTMMTAAERILQPLGYYPQILLTHPR